MVQLGSFLSTTRACISILGTNMHVSMHEIQSKHTIIHLKAYPQEDVLIHRYGILKNTQNHTYTHARTDTFTYTHMYAHTQRKYTNTQTTINVHTQTQTHKH